MKKKTLLLVEFVILDDNDNIIETLDSRTFEWNGSIYSSNYMEIENYTHYKLLDLDGIYHFVDYDDCPDVRIIYSVDGKVIKMEDCVDLYYNT